jgi:hypothetical protein
MINLDQTTPDETPKQDQKETMFEVLERLKNELDFLRIELPTILTDEFDPCEMCGS